MNGKHCQEAISGDSYKDEDATVLCKPTGPRETRIGIGSSMTRCGSSPRAEVARQNQV
jgi:hypothetical protein